MCVLTSRLSDGLHVLCYRCAHAACLNVVNAIPLSLLNQLLVEASSGLRDML